MPHPICTTCGTQHAEVPVPAQAVRRAVAAVEPLAFDRIYGFMFDLAIREGDKSAVARSADRYLRAIGADEVAR